MEASYFLFIQHLHLLSTKLTLLIPYVYNSKSLQVFNYSHFDALLSSPTSTIFPTAKSLSHPTSCSHSNQNPRSRKQIFLSLLPKKFYHIIIIRSDYQQEQELDELNIHCQNQKKEKIINIQQHLKMFLTNTSHNTVLKE